MRIMIKTLNEISQTDWFELRDLLWPNHDPMELKKEMLEIEEKADQMPVFFAYDQEVMCGFMECSLKEEAPGCHSNRILYIEGWYVRDNYRQKGVGRKLFEHASQWGKSHGCIEMASDTNENYPISPIAHKKIGFLESSIPFYYYKKL